MKPLVEVVPLISDKHLPPLMEERTAITTLHSVWTPDEQYKEHGVCIADGLVTSNDHYWPRHVWEQVRNRVQDYNSTGKPLYVTTDVSDGFGVPLDKVVGYLSHLHIVDTQGPEQYKIYAKVYLYEAIYGTKVIRTQIRQPQQPDECVYLIPLGVGHVDENRQIRHATISYMCLSLSSGFAFAQPLNNLALS